MSGQLEDLGQGNFALRGELDAHSATILWAEAKRLFKEQAPMKIDLSHVSRSDSAGVALLVEWLRDAQTQHWRLQFVNVPPQMLAIINVADLEELLPMA
jgi:phospholipid transport system transporter-binding protein